MRHHFTPTRIAISKRQTVRTEDMKKLKYLYFADRNVKSCFRKQLNRVIIWLSTYSPRYIAHF